MDEKDYLIQLQRRKIAEMTEEIRIKDIVISGYEKLLKTAISDITTMTEKMTKNVEEIYAYIQTETSDED